jgi:hypothetical protein
MEIASVKIMLSYDYCHFEVCRSIERDTDIGNKEIDNLRKDVQRLADKAVEQYKTAKTYAVQRLRIQNEKDVLLKEIEIIKQKPESDWSATEKAKVKALQDTAYWNQYDYDYQDMSESD